MLRTLLSLLLLLIAPNLWSATVENVRLSTSEQGTRLVFDLDSKVQYSTFTLANPDRLVVDLKYSKQNKTLVIPKLADTPIRAIRHAMWDKNTLRLVLDLKHTVKFESQTLSPNKTYPHRLVLDLFHANKQKVTAKSTKVAAEKAPIPKPVVTKPIPPKLSTTQPVEDKTPQARVVKTSVPQIRRDIVIAIDAGHGGQDSGALGKRGTKEKDVVLAIAKRLGTLVNKEPGMKAYLTRDKDVFITLRQRINRAHKSGADMFISIHADAFHNPRARGASVYVLSDRGASSEAAQLLADKENAADLAGGISLEDKDDLLASVLLDLSQTASLEGSLEVADTVLAGLKRVGHVHKKHVESAAFVVLKSPDIPSVLVETAFISNPDEERKLRSSSHQNKLARAMMTGIRNYFQRNPLPNSNLPQQHIVSRGDTLSTIAQRYQVSLVQLKTNNQLQTSKLRVGDVLMIP
ncbi:N-acetylmuramoyl-L-alanine amidase [Methylophaga sp. 42_25_T18]|nr:N-acetylmuramoyl-L-alanine amidase [Methylophaga sp. 42_25_T18]